MCAFLHSVHFVHWICAESQLYSRACGFMRRKQKKKKKKEETNSTNETRSDRPSVVCPWLTRCSIYIYMVRRKISHNTTVYLSATRITRRRDGNWALSVVDWLDIVGARKRATQLAPRRAAREMIGQFNPRMRAALSIQTAFTAY